MDNTPPYNDGDNRLRARLALTGKEDIANWKEREEYLEKRKIEAAKAMASDEQKKKNEEEEKARLHKIEAQKKLAELEAVKKSEEEMKKRDISLQQKEKDLAQEKIRQERIKQILESHREIEGIKRSSRSNLSSIHTLTDDLSEEVKEKGLTVARLAQVNNQEPQEKDRPVSRKKFFVLSLSIILFLGGATALVWSFVQKKDISQAPARLAHNSIIFADEHLAISLKDKSPEQLKQEIISLGTQDADNLDREKTKDLYFIYEEKKTTDSGLVIEKKIAGPQLFMTSLGLTITDDLLRFLNQDFMLGLYVGRSQVKPFFIFKTESYKNSADALIRNENEIVSQLLSPFVDRETQTKIRLNHFQDKTFKNRDLRIIIDNDNNTLAVYSWLDKNTIAITTNEAVLEQVLNSFLTSKPVVK